MSVRAIRGAITLDTNDRTEIINKTKDLLVQMLDDNGVLREDLISIFFSTTNDLNAEFPAVAAREIGLKYVSLMCMKEINVLGSLEKCIRILIHFNTNKMNEELKHIYLENAKRLRPDF